MLTEVKAGPYTVRGISVAGVYTSLNVPELDLLLDVGVPIRSFAGVDRLFLSHTHADHASALGSFLGLRNLIGKGPLQLFLPAEVEADVRDAVAVMARLHRTRFEVEYVPMLPDATHALGKGLEVRAFRTLHSVPSLGYAFTRTVQKLRPEFASLPGEEIGRRRRAGDESLFEVHGRVELAYATDTLSNVVDVAPYLFDARVLILESTYVESSRTVEETRDRQHIHLDELIARAGEFRNEAIILMHFSQNHSPRTVREILDARLPEPLKTRVVPFAPESGPWFG